MRDRILNFLIIFLLSILIVNIFFKNDNKKISEGLDFSVQANNYTIPASPILKITNNQAKEIKINTCKDIEINYSGEKLSFGNEFCKDITVGKNEIKNLEYGKYYDKFLKTGKYNFLINIEGKQYITQTNIENKGFIKKIFVGIFYAPLYNLTVFFINFFNNSLGWAILTITILIRFALLYPQHKIMVSQRKMNKIQPKIKEIQEKYKGDSQKLGIEMMNLYKKEKVNPFGSCGFLLIQMPIIIVIYNIFANIKDNSNIFYLYDFLKGFKIENIDSNFFGINLLETAGVTGIVLGITIAILQYIQVKISLVNNPASKNIVLEKKKNTNNYSSMMPDPNIMNKFMLYGLPAMVGVFTYSLLAGVGIYRGISTIFTIFQQLIVNKKVKK